MYAIETNDLCKFYGKSRGIINVNLKIECGEIFGFIGPNGAGKSTTIRTILNFIFPTSGSAKIMGFDCIKESKRIRELIGYLPSEVNYYDDMKIRELLKYSGDFYNKDCSKRIKELCDIFEVDSSKKINQLSLGNKKKVGIIQALLHEPKLIILDEPTSGLDPLMQKTFFEVLKEENKKGATIFFSSHILSEVQEMCNKVAIIKEGKILKTEEISKLRDAQFKKVMVNFNDEISSIDIPGAINAVKLGTSVKFLYNGDINDLIDNLHKNKIKNLTIEEPSLEEIFMHYYVKEDK
ncbi:MULTISPECIES: ABC transporter ATP-binding protein [Clostridium]|uniref:ABC transporter ATP-binding protein n=1 Tax=Clostridium TaxID=1485 RepID=UPI00069F23B0|nr:MULTISPECIES: ABC transporter ATP-binding protein [Clostridium]KOF56597.1 ABC transporter [Clostridium sp. DMHC 10]MCD2345599.1 ABC transporter ATP-binding protein [Clostridium guangxiense]